MQCYTKAAECLRQASLTTLEDQRPLFVETAAVSTALQSCQQPWLLVFKYSVALVKLDRNIPQIR